MSQLLRRTLMRCLFLFPGLPSLNVVSLYEEPSFRRLAIGTWDDGPA